MAFVNLPMEALYLATASGTGTVTCNLFHELPSSLAHASHLYTTLLGTPIQFICSVLWHVFQCPKCLK